jgi:DNA-binding MarR family transcriptional regulator
VPGLSPDDLPPEGEPPAGEPLPALASRLGYLLKHAQLRLAGLTASAMAPFGVTGRQCAVLIAIDSKAPLSQQEVARRLGVDRTTMVVLIDELETKGLVQRRPHPGDRRKNVVALTEAGRITLEKATRAGDEAERRFLATLSGDEAALLRKALQAAAFPAPGERPPGKR